MKEVKFTLTYALEAPTHFLFEKRSEPYNRYGEVSIAGEKCVEVQELMQGGQLCWVASRRGA